MTLFMPPIQRKKKIQERYNPDSFRVISEDAQSDHPKYKPLPYRASFEPRTPTPKVFKASDKGKENLIEPMLPSQPLKSTRVLPQVLPDFRGNKPQTLSCGFLDKNVRFLNEPICNVYTKPVQRQEKNWWPSRPNPGELIKPSYSGATENRSNYKIHEGERQAGSGRHTANSNRVPARGTVPVSHLCEKDGSKRLYKEGISYEHMYNSRLDPNYPIRGNRHGGFVWSRMDPISERKFVEYYKKLAEQEQQETVSKSSPIKEKNENTNSEPKSPQNAHSTKPKQAEQTDQKPNTEKADCQSNVDIQPQKSTNAVKDNEDNVNSEK